MFEQIRTELLVGDHLVTVLFLVLCSWTVVGAIKGWRVWCSVFHHLLFADHVVLLASLSLACTVTVCSQMWSGYAVNELQVWGLCSQLESAGVPTPGRWWTFAHVEEFKYLLVLFMSQGRMEWDWCNIYSDMDASLLWWRELSLKGKVWIYWSIYPPTFIYGHKLWVVTGRIRLQIQEWKIKWCLD